MRPRLLNEEHQNDDRHRVHYPKTEAGDALGC